MACNNTYMPPERIMYQSSMSDIESGADGIQNRASHSQQRPRSLAIETAIEILRGSQTGTPVEFAIIVYQDKDLKYFTSNALYGAEGTLFNKAFRDVFLQALQTGSSPEPYSRRDQRDSVMSYRSKSSFRQSRRWYSDQSMNCYHPNESVTAKKRRACHEIEQDNTLVLQAQRFQIKVLMIGDDVAAREWFEQKFRALQQSSCKTIAKSFIKDLEPKKQSNYPYIRGPHTAPPWWPPRPLTDEGGKIIVEGVRHKEPDHLLKKERIKLLVHILEIVADPSYPHRPQATKQLTIAELEKNTNEALQLAFNADKNAKNDQKIAKIRILDEIFRVAKKRERYRDGQLDADATITVKHDGDCEISGSEFSEERDDDEYPPSMHTPDSIASPRNQGQPQRQQADCFVALQDARYMDTGSRQYEHPTHPMQSNLLLHNKNSSGKESNGHNSALKSPFLDPQSQYLHYGHSSPLNNLPTASMSRFAPFSAAQSSANFSYPLSSGFQSPISFSGPQLPPRSGLLQTISPQMRLPQQFQGPYHDGNSYSQGGTIEFDTKDLHLR